jgi:hypothetical protein
MFTSYHSPAQWGSCWGVLFLFHPFMFASLKNYSGADTNFLDVNFLIVLGEVCSLKIASSVL